MTEFLKAFALIFVAEMGDKTQIMAMAFATQYAIKSILSGVFLGSFLNHGIAILLGSLFLTRLPMGLIQLLAGAVFIAFGLQSLNIEGDSDEEKSKAKHGAVLTVAMAFFIGELGDKTQLTAMTLGTESMYPFLTLMGTSLGMVSVSLFGIFIGAKLGGRIPEHYIKAIAFIVFIGFGSAKILQSEYVTGNIAWLVSIGILLLMGLRVLGYRRKMAQIERSALVAGAEKLKRFMEGLKADVDLMCKDCTCCDESGCMVKHMQGLLKEIPDMEAMVKVNVASLSHKGMDQQKAKAICDAIERFREEHPEITKHQDVIEGIYEAAKHMTTHEE